MKAGYLDLPSDTPVLIIKELRERWSIGTFDKHISARMMAGNEDICFAALRDIEGLVRLVEEMHEKYERQSIQQVIADVEAQPWPV